MNITEYVSKKAYFRWLDRGRHHGDDLTDWLECEKRMPRCAIMGWKPLKNQNGQADNHCLTPGLVNWKEFLCDHRRCVKSSSGIKVYQSIAWVNKYDSFHSDGHPPISRERLARELGKDFDERLFEAPFQFPSPESLLEQGNYVEFYGMTIILWIVRLVHGEIASIEFEFQRHIDSVCCDVPRAEIKERRIPTYGIHDFPRRQTWDNSCFDLGPW